jgi:thiol-disulfide isomerase/thioredoxin
VVQVTATNSAGEVVDLGTGFMVDTKGYVVTNYHVVRRGQAAFVQFRDGSKCKVNGYRALDKQGDIAILELEKPPKTVQFLPLGSKTTPAQGDGVIAIGHPQGFSFTVTTGIVSAVRKTSELPKEIRDGFHCPDNWIWLQTTAPISSGNSGGPLLDEAGRVVGVNTWVADGQNLGFALCIQHVQDLLAKAPGKTIPLALEKYARDEDNPLAKLDPRIEEIVREYRLAENQYQVQLREAADNVFANLFGSQPTHPGPKYAERLLRMADAEPKTTAAFQALCLACWLDSASSDAKFLRQALDRLAKDHAQDKGLHHGFRLILFTFHPAQVPFFRTVIKENPHRPVRATSLIALALLLFEDQQKNETEICRLLELCLKDYSDIPLEGDLFGQEYAGKSVADFVKPRLFRLQHLSIGKLPPEITGKDVDGKEFKLSDSHGKVVLLDFFADWCPHCVRMYPHERRLVSDYASRPFVILGVNAESRDTLQQLISAKTVTWRCWWDSDSSPISNEWQVDSIPTMYLLDHNGIIRQIYHGRPIQQTLDEAIKDLVAKAPVPKNAPGSKP